MTKAKLIPVFLCLLVVTLSSCSSDESKAAIEVPAQGLIANEAFLSELPAQAERTNDQTYTAECTDDGHYTPTTREVELVSQLKPDELFAFFAARAVQAGWAPSTADGAVNAWERTDEKYRYDASVSDLGEQRFLAQVSVRPRSESAAECPSPED